MSTPPALRVALAGLGTMGRNHLRVISGNSSTRLVAVGYPDAEVLDEPGGRRRMERPSRDGP